MATSGEVRVDPSVLDTAARACADLRERAQHASADAGPETEAAMAALGGWQTRDAIEAMLWAWRDDVAGFARHLARLGDGLDGAAQDYRHSDHAAADRFDLRGR